MQIKRPTNKQSKRIIIIGIIGYGVSWLVSVVALMRVYDKAGCQEQCDAVSFGFEHALSQIALWVGYTSLAAAFIGLCFLLATKKNNQ